MQTYKFSIVTPSYGQLDWLRLCVASVRDQVEDCTNGDPGPIQVEHIIQDAGTVGIEDFAHEIRADFHRDGCSIHHYASPSRSPLRPASDNYKVAIYCEKDNGMYDAVNRGIARSTGDIIAYLNCDEQYLPGALAAIASDFSSNPQLEVAFLDAIVIASDGTYICDRRVMVPERLHMLTSGNLSIFTSSTFSRATVFKKRNLIFDTSWKDLGDAEWALRLVESGLTLQAINRPASTFADTGANMNTLPNAVREKRQFRESAPKWATLAAPLILAAYRLKRLLKGLYKIRPHSYSVYTKASPNRRVEFHVASPSFRWPGRF